MASSTALRHALDNAVPVELERLIAEDPELPRRRFAWNLCAIGPCQPLAYLAQARFHGLAQHGRSGELARILLAAGAPVDGSPGDGETPLITAASYREPDVAAALIEAGANLEATGYAVKGGTALSHAVEFGAPEIADLLVMAGARVRTLVEAAGTDDFRGMLRRDTPEEERAQALRAAVVGERASAVVRLLATGLDVNRIVNGGTVLHWAAWEAKHDPALYLLARGADPRRLDPEHSLTPLGWAQRRAAEHPHAHPEGHAEVIRLLKGRERRR